MKTAKALFGYVTGKTDWIIPERWIEEIEWANEIWGWFPQQFGAKVESSWKLLRLFISTTLG